MPLDPGTRLGHFEIIFRLGAGGMGEVYRARDTRLGRDVALKVLPQGLVTDREGLIRFAQEARAASALNHPNIITIFEIGEADSSPFLAMELVDGGTLRDLIDVGPLSVKKSLELVTQITEGLAKAHQAGIVHRDLKPENIMVTKDGFVKILDFGLAKLQAPLPGAGTATAELMRQSMTRAGLLIGTPDYMSPEQAGGRPLDFRSDQFALGLILYEMLTRQRAFHRATPVQTLSAIIQDEPESLEKLNPRVPAPLRWSIDRCLSKDPEERYGATRDLARELKQIKENLGELTESGIPRLSQSAAALSATSSRVPPATTPGSIPTSAEGPAPQQPLPAPRTKLRRMGEFVLLLLLGLTLFGAGALTGIWFHGRQMEPPPPNWKADLLLGAVTPVMAPRISPDGQALAFVTLVAGASQIAVMKPSSGDWTVLTHQRGNGSAYKVCWSRDGNKIFFDRVSDVPQGIFSIPALGGEERIVLEDAQGPEALPDGSLLVFKRDSLRNLSIQRFWPETGRLSALGPSIVPESGGIVRAFPDGHAAIFWGKLAGREENVRRSYLLDLASGRVTAFAPQLPLAPPLAIGPDGKSVLGFLVTGDLRRAVLVSRDGNDVKPLFPVTGKPWQLDAGSDGSLYVSTMDNPAELLRFPSAGGVPERIAATSGNLLMSPVQFPDGGLLVPIQVLGRRRLLLATHDGELRPFLDIAEQATPPACVVGEKLVAFLSGGVGKPPLITIASIAEGRIVRRLETSSGTAPQSLAALPDGKTLYYVDAGFLYSMDIDGGTPRKLFAANGVAVDSRGPLPSLIIQVNERDGVKLYRVAVPGQTEEPIPFVSPLRLSATPPISGTAVGPDGRIAVTVTSKDSWFRGAALLDPLTGNLERVPVAFDGDILYPTWGRDGALLGMGVSIRSSLWRFQAQAQTVKE